MAAKKKLTDAVRQDGWTNYVSGIGTTRDKTTAGTFLPDCRLTDYELDAMYYNEDLAAKIVDKRPDEAFRKGYKLELENPETAEEIQKDAEQRLDLDTQIQDAWRWGRLYGGALAILGVADNQEMDQPVNESAIAGIDYVNVVDRRNIRVVSYFNDPLQANFGKPSLYEVLSIGSAGGFDAKAPVARVHADRVIRFDGLKTDRKKRYELAGWSFSILQRAYNVLRMYGVSFASMALMLSEASQGVFKIDGLIQMIASNQKGKLMERMAMVDQSKSIARSILLDAGTEEYKREPMQFGSVPDVADRFAQRLAAAFDMPVTVLMGTSPAGLNATGKSDLTLWYDSIRTDQDKILTAPMAKVYRYLCLARNVDPKDLEICWRPMQELTESEQAEIYSKTTAADKMAIEAGMVQPEEVSLARWSSGKYAPNAVIEIDAVALKKALLPTKFEVPAGDLLTPSDLATAVTINEARANKGLDPLQLPTGGDDPDGNLTVAEFQAKKEAQGAENGTTQPDTTQSPNPLGEGSAKPKANGAALPPGSGEPVQGNAPDLPNVPKPGNPRGRKKANG